MSGSCVRFTSLWDLYLWYCRFCGLVTAVSLYGAALEGFLFHYKLCIYLLIAAVIVTIFEVVFIGILISDAMNKGSALSLCHRCWIGLSWVDDWRKGILYLLMSIGCFVQPHKFWVSIIPGCLLIKCSIIYSFKTLKTRKEVAEEKRRERLKTYDKFDAEVTEDINEHALGTIQEEGIFDKEETLAEQEDILDL